MVAASSLCAGLPMFAFLTFIWWMDRYDREPLWLLSVAFLWGGFGAIAASVVLTALFASVFVGLAGPLGADPYVLDAISPIVIAPLAEEPGKAAILLLIIWHADFDNMTDGFVYGAAAGLGFGMTENFLYFLGAMHDLGIWFGTVVVRTCYSAVMHATATAIVGSALGWARFRHPRVLFLSGCFGLLVAIGVHGLWNGLLTFDEMLGGAGHLIGLDFVLLFVEALGTLAVFQICLLHESAAIRRELSDEARRGLLPAKHPRIIASWLRRNGRSWLDASIDRDHYIVLATTLAMRKWQLGQLGERASPFYAREVDRLRTEIAETLSGA